MLLFFTGSNRLFHVLVCLQDLVVFFMLFLFKGLGDFFHVVVDVYRRDVQSAALREEDQGLKPRSSRRVFHPTLGTKDREQRLNVRDKMV